MWSARTAKHLLTTTQSFLRSGKGFPACRKDFVSDAGEPLVAAAKVPEKVYSQIENNAMVLKAIGLAYQCWNTGSNTVYIEPADLIYNSNKQIIGQKFLYPVNDRKFMTVKLNIVNSSIPTASFGQYLNSLQYCLTWKENKLAGIKIDRLSEFDFLINYENDSIITGFTTKQLFNGNIQTVTKIEYKNGKIAGITKYENNINEKDPWIRSIKTFEYTDYGNNR
jgi:hypothetical protein